MNSSFGRKTALVACILLLSALAVFFACACGGRISIDLALDGEILPGETLTAEIEITGEGNKVKIYSESDYDLSVKEGDAIASVSNGRVVIAESAREGEEFLLELTVKDLTVEKRFTVAASPVESVDIVAPATAEAGDEITLSATILPAAAANKAVVYTLVSGAATIDGATLRVSEDADLGEIVVKATAGGVSSIEKHIAITTVQTKEIYLTLSGATALPRGVVTYIVRTEPQTTSYPTVVSVESGANDVSLDETARTVTVKETAAMGAEIVILAQSGKKSVRQTLRVDYPAAQNIVARGGGGVAPGTERSFEYELVPAEADRSRVEIELVEGEEYVEWTGGTAFRVTAGAPQGAEITFLIDAGDDVYTTVSYRVESRTLNSLTIEAQGSTSYLKSGQSLTFSHRTDPADYDGDVIYRATSGADLVTISGDTVTVKDGADMGFVTVVAESADGTRSNEVVFSVAGRYSRRAYSNWSNVSLSGAGENASVWMVLPAAMNAGCLTVIVPYDVVDLVIEGRYDGTDATAYKDLYFYFRNTAERTVTLWNFATVATQGLGGVVMDFGSSGTTEIVLKGDNLVRADSPYRVDVTGEDRDGVWNNGYGYESLCILRRSGKDGYQGTAGGTAVSGYSLSFLGSGTLTAVAGSGVNGTAGGNGADAAYQDGVTTYVSGAGGDGGHGGDSGAAIYAYRVSFAAGLVTALPGNAGKGAMGGAAGSLSALVGKEVVMISGGNGSAGRDGTPRPSVCATKISGINYLSTTGSVVSSDAIFTGGLPTLTEKISSFYGVGLYYGTALYNPYKKNPKSSRYSMEVQNDPTVLMRQANFLMYTMSMMPKNCWQELAFVSGKRVTIYFAKSITSGSGGTILGLTSSTNNVWFATFNTEVRGAYYGGYFNIMMHEFTHAFHYQFTTAERTSFETDLKSRNYGLDYKSSYGATDRVYGVSGSWNETNSCFLSAYSRKNVMEDTAETVSMASAFLSAEPPMTAGTAIRAKFDLLATAFGRMYETLSPFSRKASCGKYLQVAA